MAGLRSESRAIGEHTYRVTQLPAGKGRQLLTRLFKVLGPAVGELAKGAPGGKAPSLGDLEVGSFGEALGMLAERITEQDLDHLCAVLAATTTLVEGANELRLADVFDLHFAGRYGEMFRWIRFALEVNYADFFGALASLAAPEPPVRLVQ